MNGKLKVLYIDDQPNNLTMVRRILDDDYHVIPYTDGSKALQSIDKVQPDLILLDIMMPDMDGYEVCRRFKSMDATKEIPIIFVTAKGEEEDESLGFELGAVDYITKPVKPALLRARVRTHIELRKKVIVERNLTRLREDVDRITRHDLKTPLNAVISLSQLMMKDGLSEKQVKWLGIINESGHKLLNMINLSLDLYKMEQGMYRIENPAPVDIISTLEDITRDSRTIIESKRIAIEISINGCPQKADSRFEITGEKLLFYSMLANLIKNAIEASPIEGKIAARLSETDGLAIAIHNRCAVPEDMRECFFEKYTSFGKSGGSGLGTYSARLIAETLGGRISMNSSEENGTTVTIIFPKNAQ